MSSTPREAWGDLAVTAFVEANLLFRPLDAEAHQDLMRMASVEDFEAGELVAADAEDDKFYLIREGTAAVLLEKDGAAFEVAVLEKGAFFGEGRVLGNPVAGALVARTDVSVVTFPAQVVAALSERFPKVHKLLETIQAVHRKNAAQRLGGPTQG